MSEGLVKSMWTGLPPGVDGALELLSGGVLGPGDGADGADDSQEDLDEESDWRDITMFLLYSGLRCNTGMTLKYLPMNSIRLSQELFRHL